jgi:hypothetical protein
MPKTCGPTATGSLPLCTFGATAKVFRDRGVRFVCGPTKLEPPGIHNFDIFDRGGKLLEFGQKL